MTRYKIEVTAQDIEEGRRRICTRCPIALAIRRSMRHNVAVSMAGSRNGLNTYQAKIYTSPLTVLSLQLPQEAADFIHLFDRRGRTAVQPFTFHLEIPWL